MNNNYRRGNMWDAWESADTFCITTNSYVRNDGSLVMGAGIAKQAREVFGGLPQRLGSEVEAFCGHLGTYGVLPGPHKLWAFQVKHHWKDGADAELIETSAKLLAEFGEGETHLNFPGIGNGGLEEEDVRPVLERNLEGVYIWQYE